MGTKLFVGNIAFDVTEDEISEIFKRVGNVVNCHLVVDHNTNRSKGFAFVEMESEDDAEKAMDDLDGTKLNGREIVVSEARERQKTQRGPRDNYPRYNNDRQIICPTCHTVIIPSHYRNKGNY